MQAGLVISNLSTPSRTAQLPILLWIQRSVPFPGFQYPPPCSWCVQSENPKDQPHPDQLTWSQDSLGLHSRSRHHLSPSMVLTWIIEQPQDVSKFFLWCIQDAGIRNAQFSDFSSAFCLVFLKWPQMHQNECCTRHGYFLGCRALRASGSLRDSLCVMSRPSLDTQGVINCKVTLSWAASMTSTSAPLPGHPSRCVYHCTRLQRNLFYFQMSACP